MSDEEMSQDDLDREIEAALEGASVIDIAQQELLGVSSDVARARAAAGDSLDRGFREGTVAGVTKNDVFLEFGPRDQGVVPFEQFAEEPKVGDKVRVFVETYDKNQGIYICSLRRTAQSASWDSLEVGAVLVGVVRATNAGGLEVQTGLLTAFLPVSHIELSRVEDMEPYIGQRVEVEVIDLDPAKKRLVVSRRGILARQRDLARSEAAEGLLPGSVIKGKVMKVEPFGAFVDVGGVEGLVHVSQMAWKRVENAADHVEVGQELEVQVLEVSEDGKRISLSMRALQEDPWQKFILDHPVNSQVEGTVTKVASYGAFIEVADGVEGLAHVSQLAPGGADSVRAAVRIGQKLTVRVANVEPERKRIGLSLLTDRGDRLTDDVADDATIRDILNRSDDAGEPTLGDILRKAMEEKKES